MSEKILRECPFCGKMPRAFGVVEKVQCINEDCSNAYSRPLTPEAWNMRPIEDALQERIAGLEAENEALRDAQRCIPVAERLPEDYKRVLIEFDDGSISIATHSIIHKQWSTIDKLHFHGDSYNWVVAWRELPDGSK